MRSFLLSFYPETYKVAQTMSILAALIIWSIALANINSILVPWMMVAVFGLAVTSEGFRARHEYEFEWAEYRRLNSWPDIKIPFMD